MKGTKKTEVTLSAILPRGETFRRHTTQISDLAKKSDFKGQACTVVKKKNQGTTQGRESGQLLKVKGKRYQIEKKEEGFWRGKKTRKKDRKKKKRRSAVKFHEQNKQSQVIS